MKQEKSSLEKVFNRPATRRQLIKAGGIAALGIAFSKPIIETLRPSVAFASGGQTFEPVPSDPIYMEAEEMDLFQYQVEPARPHLIKKVPGAPGTATAPFPGPDGNYRVDVDVAIEHDGQSTLELWIGGEFIQGWKYPLGDTGFPIFTLHGPTLYVANGVEIKLVGRDNGGAFARVDRIIFTPEA